MSKTTTITKTDEWWTRVDRDRDPRTGEPRVRLRRFVLDDVAGWKPVHTWRIRPEFWEEERKAVSRFERGAGTTSPPPLPTHPDLDIKRYLRVRRDSDRWVAVVRAESPYRPPFTRLYHWKLPEKTTCQKWTIGDSWTQERDVATRQL